MEGKLYSLFKRNSVWYVQFKKPNNTFSTARTTRKRSKVDAERFAIELLKNGMLVVNERVTFATFAGDFFNWNGEWALDKRARGLCLSEHHCQTLSRTFKKWVLPVFGECRLVQVDRAAIKLFRYMNPDYNC